MPNETSGNGDSVAGQDLAELRGLLLGPEQAQIAALRRTLEDPALFAEVVGTVLAEAVRLRSSRDARLQKSLEPIVERAISVSVRRNPSILSSALFPVVGAAVRKAVAAALHAMLESLNQALEHGLSARAIRWRLEALRTGRSFGEVVLLRSLLYRVEQVFLIHRQTGIVLQHRAREAKVIKDADLISGMLTAIQNFVADSFGGQPEQELETMQVGSFSVWIQSSPRAILAGVVRGTPPDELRTVFQRALEQICLEQAAELDRFDGDTTPFQVSARHLDSCLLGHLPLEKKSPAQWIRAAAVGLLFLGVAFWAHASYVGSRSWNRYLDRLRMESGIVVTAAGERTGGYYVSGLRDPLSTDPAALLAGTGVDRGKVSFRWEPYLSLQPRFVAMRRMEAARTATQRSAIRFAADSAELSAGQLDVLGQVAAEIQAMFTAARDVGKTIRLEIVGHTDISGTEARNTRLAVERAIRVLEALAAAGISRDLLSVRGAGSSEPVRRGVDAVDSELNRSVSFRFIAENQ